MIFDYGSIQIIAIQILIFSCVKLVLTIIYEPYHNSKTQIIALLFNAIEAWVSIVLNIPIFLSWLEFDMNIIMLIIGSPFFIIVVVNTWKTRNRNILKMSLDHEQIYNNYLKIRKLIQIYEDPNEPENLLWINDMLFIHLKYCKDEKCELHEDFRRAINSNKFIPEQINEAYLKYLDAKYKVIVKANFSDIFIRIAYSLFLCEFTKNRVMSIVQLEEAQSSNPNILYELLIGRNKESINK